MTKDNDLDVSLLANGDTWSISGPTFLRLFLFLSAVAIVATFVLRYRYLHAEPDEELLSKTPPTAMQLAFLRDASGPTLVAMTTLHRLGIIDSRGFTLRMPTAADQLDDVTRRALSAVQAYRADPRPSQHPLNGLNSSIGDEVRARRWMYTEADIWRARLNFLWPLAAVATLGAIRIFAGISNGKPVSLLLLCLALLLIPLFFAISMPRLTPAGQRVLAHHQQLYSYLQPQNRPSLRTYGPEAVTFSAALFGAGTLMFYDPTFATADILSAGEAARAAARSGQYTSNNSGGCGSSSSCSSSSGSSSCGGGGCGGGGCGG